MSGFTKAKGKPQKLVYSTESGASLKQDGLYYTSTGTDLDKYIKGFPLGSLIFISEDLESQYYLNLIRTIIAQFIQNLNHVIVVERKNELIKLIPLRVKRKEEETEADKKESNIQNEIDKVENNNKSKEDAISKKPLYYFKLTRHMEKGKNLESLYTFIPLQLPLQGLWKEIYNAILKNLKDPSDKKLFCIIIHDIQDYLVNIKDTHSKFLVIEFIKALKILARSLNGIIIISMSKDKVDNLIFKYAMSESDIAIEFKSLHNEPTKIGSYQGLIFINKSHYINKLGEDPILNRSLGFYHQSGEICIELLDLDPIDLSKSKKEMKFNC